MTKGDAGTIYPYMETASGRDFALVHPTPEMVDFDDIAEHLGKIARFAGATPGVFYSVAEHCVRAAEAVWAQTKDENLAGIALLHDAHEAYIVDRITPEKWAEEYIAAETFGASGLQAVRGVPAFLRYRIDDAIHAAAGLPWPLASDTQERIKHIDLVMLATERRDLMRPSKTEWPNLKGIEPLPNRIYPMSWPEAWRAYKTEARRFLPALRKSLAHNKRPSEQGGEPG